MPDKPDLTGEVTVFVVTVGGPTYWQCRQALDAQDSSFNLEIIDHVAPMNAAFQQMINRCKTPYYIQVDEDMILRPHAVRTMVEQFRPYSGTPMCMIAYPLWDAHVRRTILGVKIYDHAIFQKYPYQDTQSCEMNQLKRMEKDGYGYLTWGGRHWSEHQGHMRRDDPIVLGEHGTLYGPREAFERYKDLVEKYRHVGGVDWIAPWITQFLLRAAPDLNADDPDFWSFLGSIAGLVSKEQTKGEKDFRSYPTMEDYGEMAAHIINPPQRLDVYVTNSCNAKCTFCARQKGRLPRSSKDFDVHMARKTLDMFPSIKSACVAGFGEPLTSPEITPLIHELFDRQLVIGLITNGMALTKHGDIPWRRFAYTNISVNAGNAEEHEATTKVPGGFDEVLRGAKMLKDLNARFCLSFVISRSNWRNIPDYLRLTKQTGAAFATFVNILPHHDVSNPEANQRFWSQVLTRDFVPYRNEVGRFMKLAKELNVKVTPWPTLIDRSHCPRLCRSPWTSIGVDGDGNVTGCCRVQGPGGAKLIRGPELWLDNMYLRNLRRSLSGSKPLPTMCSMCFGNWQRG